MRIVASILVAVIAACLTLPVYARGGGGHGGHSGGSHSHSRATGTGSTSSRTHVSAYTKKDGTRVQAHNRSKADRTKLNNWSTKGNVNPDTGKAGTKSE